MSYYVYDYREERDNFIESIYEMEKSLRDMADRLRDENPESMETIMDKSRELRIIARELADVKVYY